jgi:hypothetical protein
MVYQGKFSSINPTDQKLNRPSPPPPYILDGKKKGEYSPCVDWWIGVSKIDIMPLLPSDI